MILLVSPEIYHEMDFFLSSILTGAALMLVNELLVLFRALVHHHTAAVAVEDVLYWFGAAVAVFFMVFLENDGLVRGFAALGIILGALLFRWTFGRLFAHFVKKLRKKH